MDMDMNMENDIKEILYSEKEIKETVEKLGKIITEEYKDKKLLLTGLLKGCFIFMSDLAREIKLPCKIDFMVASSYGSGTVSSGTVKIKKDIGDVSGLDVLIVEDIIDSGITLKYVTEHIKSKGAKSVKICTMFNKKERRIADIDADYTGKYVPDEFIVGYGLDFDEKYRNLPYVGILNPGVYED